MTEKSGSERLGNLLKVTQRAAQARAQVWLLPGLVLMPLPLAPNADCLWIRLPLGGGTCKPEWETFHTPWRAPSHSS